MPSFDDAGLDARELARIDAALARDPALADELDLIAAQFSESGRRCFWSAFADECGGHARPAAAVLVALERAAGRPDH